MEMHTFVPTGVLESGVLSFQNKYRNNMEILTFVQTGVLESGV